MKYLKDYREGDRVQGVYLCKHKQAAVTKNGKNYLNVILQDKSGTMDAKVWDPNSMGIEEFEPMDYIEVGGDVSSFQSSLQISVKRVRVCREGEYNPADYLPTSEKNIEEMYQELLSYINSLNCYFFYSAWSILQYKEKSIDMLDYYNYIIINPDIYILLFRQSL